MGQYTRVVLDRGSSIPVYRQIADRVRAWIASGELAPGDRLPPSRELAETLGVNRNTIASAYDELVKSGDVRSHVGQGTFVAASPATEPPRSPLRFRFSRAVGASAELVQRPPLASAHPDPIDFATLVPDEELFPVEPFRKVLDTVLRRDGKTLLQYGPAAGHPPLRAYIAERLRERGVEASAENVLIVNGSQQGLDLICRSLLDPDDRVAIESPTYTIVLPLLAQYHARVEPIPMTDRGMDLEALEAALERSRPKLVFTMPTFHNPTGITMDLDSRKRLLDLASRFETPVIEDDFDSELRFGGDPLPPLKALDERGSVLHIGTFSKGLFPGLRLGYVVAHPSVVATLGRAKLIADYHTSLVLQAAVLEFCREGLYDRHLKRLAAIYRDKSQTLTRALARYFPRTVSWTRPDGGYAFWVTLPEALSAEALLEESGRAGVLFTPGSNFFHGGEGDRYLRLSISKVPNERITEGIERLGAILARYETESNENPKARALLHEPALHI